MLLGVLVLLGVAAPLLAPYPPNLQLDDANLLKPSLVGLWLSQLIVFAAYPRFAAKRGQRAIPAWTLGLIASALAVYGLWTTVHQAST